MWYQQHQFISSQALVSIALPESKLASMAVKQIQKGTLRSTQIEF